MLAASRRSAISAPQPPTFEGENQHDDDRAEQVKTKDWSLLESGHEHKWYAKGVGVVRTESSGGEVATLISVTKK